MKAVNTIGYVNFKQLIAESKGKLQFPFFQMLTIYHIQPRIIQKLRDSRRCKTGKTLIPPLLCWQGYVQQKTDQSKDEVPSCDHFTMIHSKSQIIVTKFHICHLITVNYNRTIKSRLNKGKGKGSVLAGRPCHHHYRNSHTI